MLTKQQKLYLLSVYKFTLASINVFGSYFPVQ